MTAYATNQQILDAFTRLTDTELLALRESARQRCGGTRFSEALDLIHEALYLTLEGRRNWPLHVEFTLYLAMTMRSVSDAERKRHATRLTLRVSFEEMEETAPHRIGSARSAEEEASAAEQSRISRAVLAQASRSLSHDAQAQAVFAGLLEGRSPADLRAELDMTVKQFDAARHRAMRQAKNAAALH